jgi:mono/diheme cytochrome c family protein
MSWRRGGFLLAVLVLIGTVIVATGLGQGNPPPKLALNATAAAREVRAIGTANAEVKHGEQLFDVHGCNACHTMAAGGYDGRLGPRLDVQSQGDSVNAVEMNIKHPPDDDKGYEAGLMPENFGSRLSASDLHALAVYVHAAASAAQGGGNS